MKFTLSLAMVEVDGMVPSWKDRFSPEAGGELHFHDSRECSDDGFTCLLP